MGTLIVSKLKLRWLFRLIQVVSYLMGPVESSIHGVAVLSLENVIRSFVSIPKQDTFFNNNRNI